MIKNRLIDPLIAHVRRHPMRSALLVLLTAATSAAFWQSDNASIPQQPQAQWVQVQPQLVEQQLGLLMALVVLAVRAMRASSGRAICLAAAGRCCHCRPLR